MRKKNHLCKWSVLAGLLALAGCAAGPEYVRPAAPVPAALTREPLSVTGSDAAVRSDWWTAFGSPELDAWIDEALAGSPGIEAARATLRVAHENVVAQRGYFWPSVQLGYNPSRQNTGKSMSAPLNNGDSLYTYHTAQLSVSYAADLFGGNRRQVEGLVAAEDGQRLQLQAARLSLAGNLAGAVLQTAMLQEQAALVQEAIDVAQQQLAHMRKLQANGYASGLDVATQQTLLLQLQQTLPPLHKELQQTRNLVAVLMGRTPDQAPPVPALSSFKVQVLPQAVASALLAQRPDVQLAETAVRQANAAVGVAEAARLPQLSITAMFGGGATALSQMFSSGNLVWSLGAGLVQPLFSGGTLSARQRAAEAEWQAAGAQYKSTVLSAFQDVANALYALDADTKALAMAHDSEAASRQTLGFTAAQLREGYASRPSELAARQSWLQARAASVAAQGAWFGDAVALYQALGGGVLQGGEAMAQR